MGLEPSALELHRWKVAPSLDFLNIIENVPWRFDPNVLINCSKTGG